MGGTANLLNQPEFKDVNRVQDLLHALENGALIQNIISPNPRPRSCHYYTVKKMRSRQSGISALYMVRLRLARVQEE